MPFKKWEIGTADKETAKMLAEECDADSFAALIAVNLTSRFTGVHIPINIYTVPSAAVFGIPACAVLVILETVL